MKAVVQRCLSASVAVDGQTISSIGKGLMVLVGIDRYDEPIDSTTTIKKILSAKLFPDEQDGSLWQKTVVDIGGEVLCVSQFTLLAVFKGSKPDFHDSMSTIPGKAMYTSFLEEIKSAYQPDKIKDGQFGAMMQVSLVNDGPTTIIFDSRDNKRIPKPISQLTSKANSGTSTPSPQTPTSISGDKSKSAEQTAKEEEKARRKVEFEKNKDKLNEIAKLAEERKAEKLRRNQEMSNAYKEAKRVEKEERWARGEGGRRGKEWRSGKGAGETGNELESGNANSEGNEENKGNKIAEEGVDEIGKDVEDAKI